MNSSAIYIQGVAGVSTMVFLNKFVEIGVGWSVLFGMVMLILVMSFFAIDSALKEDNAKCNRDD